ncbi:MAG: O-antigen ligase family protein [Candidatus Pacebacteria bacterium]|nr:O-antigen ligase family protein [Candidatus Paceibacterota bacterium]
MGKQSRIKKERKTQIQEGEKSPKEEKQISFGWEKFLKTIIFWGASIALLTPLIYSSKYYFPFVGPKSLYFMFFCQVIFFAWLILALYDKKYRPKMNTVILAFGLFLFFMTVSSVFGVDPSRSFWSKFERMSGLLMWLNMAGFILAVSSTLKNVDEWKKIFFVSLGVAFFVSLFGILERLGVKAVTFSDRMGVTLGNTSFLGSYLVFNFFIAVYLFFQEKKNLILKISLGFVAVLAVVAIFLQEARAALGVCFGGVLLIGVLYLAFKVKNKGVRLGGKVALVLGSLAVVVSVILVYLPNNPVHNLFGKMATEGRFANWEIAQKGFLERPFFGWGPETYDILFPKYFNPCLFTQKCGGEFWFDRTHNIILDTLVGTGAFGFLAYLGIFFALIWVLRKKYFKDKTIDFWTFAVFIALPVAYFIQNLTVFDMVGSLMMFSLVLAFVAFLAVWGSQKKNENRYIPKSKWPMVMALIFGFLVIYYFSYKPWQLDKGVILAVQNQYQNDRLQAYQKCLMTSSLGKYQITDFFSDFSQNIVQNNLEKAPKEDLIREIEAVAKLSEERKKDSPLDYRITLKLAQIYNTYVLLDPSKIDLAEQYGKEAMSQSPNNQQSYWVLAQTELYKQNIEEANKLAQQAIDLEPGVLKSYQIASQVAAISGNQEKAIEIAKKAVEINPDWLKDFSILPQSQATSAESLTK